MSQLQLDYQTDELINYKPIHAKKATFKSGQESKVHQWFRLTPSFGPDLVRLVLNQHGYSDGEVVYDPFSGAGTTQIECQLMGVHSFGTEINPLLHFVGETCLEWDLNIRKIESLFAEIEKDYHNLSQKVGFSDLEKYGLEIPEIYNPLRWWRKDVLADLLVLKEVVNKKQMSQKYSDFFNLALVSALVPDLTNVTLGRLQLHFIDRSEDEINVLHTFKERVQTMINDLKTVQENNLKKTSHIIQQDSTQITENMFESKVDHVITSPPYANRYSYVWNTRPHLYFIDMFNNSSQAAELDKKTIGGTWGSATSSLKDGIIEPYNDVVHEVVSDTTESIREQSNLMANYAMKYFNLLTKQIISMDKILTKDAKVAYVVGNSRLKSVYVETDFLLAKIFERLGLNYTISEVRRFRKRNSGKDLYESIIYARK